MEAVKRFFSHPLARRISFVILTVLLLYVIRNMLNLLMLLFVVTYVMGRLQNFLVRLISRVIPISEKLVIIILYVLLVAGILSAILNYVPIIINQVGDLINNITHFMASPYNDETIQKLDVLLEKVNYQSYLGSVLTYIKLLGSWLEIILMVIILSFFFLLQRQKVADFTKTLRTSKISWLYGEFEYYGGKFVSSFGKVIEVQLLIAVFNTIFTMIGLILLGFPYLIALTVLVFLLSLIPVAGVMISFIPIGIIGYQLGGYTTVIWTVVMVLVIHALETYILNPRLYAQKTKLPMFYTFIVLIFSQHYLGIWGLIIGIPIFMFFLDLMDVNRPVHPKQTEKDEQTEQIED